MGAVTVGILRAALVEERIGAEKGIVPRSLGKEDNEHEVS